MRTLDLDGWVRELDRQIGQVKPAIIAGLAEGAAVAVEIAKDKIGEYQPAIGSPGSFGMWPAWADLADSTKADRVRQGFNENDPLLRTGELRDSISATVTEWRLTLGSTSQIAIYQELGTAYIPPRPFLAPALWEAESAIGQAVGAALTKVLSGAQAPPPKHSGAIRK